MIKAKTNKNQKGNDEYYTPRYAIEPLLRYLPKHIKVWECTDYGESNITKVLRENGWDVVATRKENFNFLTDTPDFEFDCIVTNPPYSLKDEFLERCYRYGKPFALLMPITALEETRRGWYYRKNGLELIVFDKRVSFVPGKSNWFNTSWFCWKLLNKELNFEELEVTDNIKIL